MRFLHALHGKKYFQVLCSFFVYSKTFTYMKQITKIRPTNHFKLDQNMSPYSSACKKMTYHLQIIITNWSLMWRRQSLFYNNLVFKNRILLFFKWHIRYLSHCCQLWIVFPLKDTNISINITLSFISYFLYFNRRVMIRSYHNVQHLQKYISSTYQVDTRLF